MVSVLCDVIKSPSMRTGPERRSSSAASSQARTPKAYEKKNAILAATEIKKKRSWFCFYFGKQKRNTQFWCLLHRQKSQLGKKKIAFSQPHNKTSTNWLDFNCASIGMRARTNRRTRYKNNNLAAMQAPNDNLTTKKCVRHHKCHCVADKRTHKRSVNGGN